MGDKFNFFIFNVLKWVNFDIVGRGFFLIVCEDFFGLSKEIIIIEKNREIFSSFLLR